MPITLFVILFSALSNPITSMVGSFLTGIIVDIWMGNPLGEYALIYLAISFIINLYKRKFEPDHIAFLLLFTILATSAVLWYESNFRFSQDLMIKSVSLNTLGMIVLWSIVQIWNNRFERKNR